MKNRELSAIRVALVAGLLIATAAVLQARGRMEVQPKADDLQSLPSNIAAWHSITLPIDPEVLIRWEPEITFPVFSPVNLFLR